MGWMDYGSNVKLEPTFSLNLTNTNGIGTASVSDYGASLSTMQCYVISNSKMLMMSSAPSLDANVLITLDKIEP
jgi:hypothetical protein